MTWTPVAQQSEAWTNDTREARVFSPLVFSLHPVFDTGSLAGVYAVETKQPEVWTEA
jgi:hypothetical protein